MNSNKNSQIVNLNNGLATSTGSIHRRIAEVITRDNQNSGTVKILWSGWQGDWIINMRNVTNQGCFEGRN